MNDDDASVANVQPADEPVVAWYQVKLCRVSSPLHEVCPPAQQISRLKQEAGDIGTQADNAEFSYLHARLLGNINACRPFPNCSAHGASDHDFPTPRGRFSWEQFIERSVQLLLVPRSNQVCLLVSFPLTMVSFYVIGNNSTKQKKDPRGDRYEDHELP
jgi:hypothetical protein